MRRLLPILLTLLLACGVHAAAQDAQADSTSRFAPLDSLLTQFYDRFEQSVTVFEDPKDKDYLQANVTVHVAPTFFSWVFQYNGGFSIVGPKGVKEKYEEHIRNALDVQN